ncbi:hypothetical protein [Sandaracinus amylolyticus]|uniref:hypothetical protein n=1 Tax=Sandaracinus amylolyticus TaxID=927083 RepID=UPI001F179E52|nr:hypothetical protein [Sandaracinus amylolyticus]UJR87047.1 Hypothetical protein I5071_91480 [Sandaracinus amylolyticus]
MTSRPPPDPAPAAPPPRAPTQRPRASRAWLLVLALAVVEIVAHVVTQSRVVPWSDWQAAAARVRAEWREGDVVTSAPHWADPLMRAAVGDLLDVRSAGRADLAPYSRLWQLSIRGHRTPEAPQRAPDHVELVGRVRIERWDLAPEPILYDLVEHVMDAEVALIEGDEARACRPQRGGRPSGGGLGSGPMTPAERHVCDPRRPWLWVGATVEEDLEMLPRRCVWQHPPGEEPVRATYRDVPLGERVVLHAGLWWEHERTMSGGEVDVVVRVDGQEIGRLVHRDGDGWKRIEAAIPEALRGQRGTIDVDVSAPNPHLRTLCWAASTREAAR